MLGQLAVGPDRHQGELQAAPSPSERGDQQQTSCETSREAGSIAVGKSRKEKVKGCKCAGINSTNWQIGLLRNNFPSLLKEGEFPIKVCTFTVAALSKYLLVLCEVVKLASILCDLFFLRVCPFHLLSQASLLPVFLVHKLKKADAHIRWPGGRKMNPWWQQGQSRNVAAQLQLGALLW